VGCSLLSGRAGGGEKTKGVEVRAGDGEGFDDVRDLGGHEAEREGVVADLVGGLAIHHGPLVEAVTAEEGGAGLRGDEEITEPRDEGAAGGRERGEGDDGRGGGRRVGRGGRKNFTILRPAEVGAGGFAGEREVGAGVPAAEPRGAKRVVVKQEIVDRVFLAAAGTGDMRIGPHAHAGLVRGGAGLPRGLGENGGLRARRHKFTQLSREADACKIATEPLHTNPQCVTASGTTIDPYVQHIRDALWRTPNRGLASVMVGAGFSRNAEAAIPDPRPFPLWHELAKRMAEGIGLANDGKTRDPLLIAQMYDATLGRAELHRLIERQVPDAEWRPAALHGRLMALPWADVFTTNYDTLLERTFSLKNYERIVSPRDVAMRQPPRLVKLHGTIGSGGKLIATQEDYRCYPQTHAPFVNLVRQAVMETVFVLIGFTGDDPNFLEWIGWVRDILGDEAPKIYLCGLFDDSVATRALLDSRGVTPVNLSEVAACCKDENRHAFALDWFLAALESGKPGRPLKWAPREASAIVRIPPLPPTKKFTPFAGYPTTGPGNSFDADQLRPVITAWRAQRKDYPGWHLAPDSVRERIWRSLPEWRAAVFFHSEKLPVTERVLSARELCWRLEVCLSPIFTNETDKLVLWLEALNPFGSRLDLPNASAVSEEDAAEVGEGWIALALHVLRTAREDLDEDRYRVWRGRLIAVAGNDPAIAGELRHEEAQWNLNRLDLKSLRAGLTAWQIVARQPLELARLAALFAEMGDADAADKIARAAVNAARSNRSTLASVSLEAWSCLLLDTIHWRDTEKKSEWRERIDVAKEQGYSPWETLESLQAAVKSLKSRRIRRVELKVGFDAGEIRRTVHTSGPGREEMAAWQVLRLMEKAPCPIFVGGTGLLRETAALAAVWIGDSAPFWSLSTLLRANANRDVLNELFDKAAIALLKPDQVAQLHAQLLRIIESELPGVEPATSEQRDRLGHRILETALDLLSRVALRLGRPELEEIAACAAQWLSSPSVMAHHELHEPIGSVIERVAEALPYDALSGVTELFLRVPMLGEPDCQPNFAHHWPEPFEGGSLSARHVSPPVARSTDWPQTWTRLIAGLRSEHPPHLRERAFGRAYFLHDNGWLTTGEQTAFGEAVWSQVDSGSGLPRISGYLRSVALHLPLSAEHDAAGKVRRALLDRPLLPWKNDAGAIELNRVDSFARWLNNVTRIFRPMALADQNVLVLPLDEHETVALLERLLTWWPVAMETLANPRWRDVAWGFDADSVVDRFGRMLGESLLFFLPCGHALGATTETCIADLAQRGFSTIGFAPGRLRQRPDLVRAVNMEMEQALVSDDERKVAVAAQAIDRWRRAAAASLVPSVPRDVVGLLVTRVRFYRPAAFDAVVNCLVRFVAANDGQIDTEFESQLLRALEYLADETTGPRLRERFLKGEIEREALAYGQHARTWAARLAKELMLVFEKRGLPPPAVLEQWKLLCESDSLPENRRLWDDAR
jgi:hypothetical protein